MTDRAWIAERLRQAAEILQAQGANPFKLAAYRKAAETIANSSADLRDILERQKAVGGCDCRRATLSDPGSLAGARA